MRLRQISVFLENRPGRLARACRALADAGIDLLAATVVDSREFGILRAIVADPVQAERVLTALGCAVNVTEVLAVEVADRPGGMAAVLETLDAGGINVEYAYAFAERRRDRAAVVLRFADPDKAMAVLEKAGLRVLAPVEVFGQG